MVVSLNSRLERNEKEEVYLFHRQPQHSLRLALTQPQPPEDRRVYGVGVRGGKKERREREEREEVTSPSRSTRPYTRL